jgi:tRNA nucleotidyltransferase (CCA-adding enzyme)
MTKEPVFLKSVREKLRPKEDFFKKVEVFVEDINLNLKKSGVDAVCVTGGSVAKGTLIKDDHDADLFIKFDYGKYKYKDLSILLEKVLIDSEKKFDKVHGSRDYFQIIKGNLVYELVPVLNITDPSLGLNVTDMSPLHVDWIKKHTNKKMLDDIRLAKQFCKANELYGAESFIGGFSGHILDILVVHHGSFMNLLDASLNWGDEVIIDIEHQLDDPFNDLNSSKTNCPMIIIDPVQPDRNAAAALGFEKFNLFKEKAKEFLNNPSEDFFKKKKFNINSIKKKKIDDSKLFILEITPLVGKTDIVGAKMLKAHKFIEAEIKRNDFTIFESDWYWDKKDICIFYYFIKDEKLSAEIEQRGPLIQLFIDAERFKVKHKTVYGKNGRLYSKVKRTYTTPSKLIKDLIKGDHVKDRVKKIKLVLKQ